MKKIVSWMLAVLLFCLSAMAEVTTLPDGAHFLSSRETAQEIIDIINADFAGETGAFAFDMVLNEMETEISFASSENSSQCIQVYDETNMGVSSVIFLTYTVDDAYMCASMLYHIVEMFYGSDVNLINWFNPAFVEAFEGVQAGGYGHVEYPMESMDVIVEIAEVEGEIVFAIALECDYFLAVY